MPTCDTCGNKYERPLEIRYRGKSGTFDCFECAIHALAPVCEHCHCRIIGHGIEADGHFFCCAHCARHAGVVGARDHVESAPTAAPSQPHAHR